MISGEVLKELAEYWDRESVKREKATLGGRLSGTELAQIWQEVGMPIQDWWIFSFSLPSDIATGQPDVRFGSVARWALYYRLADGSCVVRDEQGRDHFANSTIGSFARMLMLWDIGYRRNERESPGDSGEDWDHGSLIVQEMLQSMRAIDPAAFEDESFLWPTIIFPMG